MSFVRAAAVIALCAGCGTKSDPSPPPRSAPPADAGVDGVTTILGFDPASGMHLDDDTPRSPTRKPNRQSAPIGITLKSTPRGATVFVDGENLGTTPAYWSGVADGNEHEFAFTKPTYGLARYRFVPVTSGTIHATLERVSDTPGDGGIEYHPPHFDAAVAPPPTVLTPVDHLPLDAARMATPDAPPVPAPTDADTMPPETPPSGPNP